MKDHELDGNKIAEVAAAANKRQKLSDVNLLKSRTKLALSIQQAEEKKLLLEKINEMIHVSCNIRPLRCVEELEPLCMVHRLYKCWCYKRKIITDENKPPAHRTYSKISSFNLPTIERYVMQNGKSQNVSINDISEIEHRKDSSHSFQIENLTELMDGKKGPIFINVFENKLTRSDMVCNFILRKHYALIYFNCQAYYVDQKRVDTKRIDFSKINHEFEGPIFIIQSKHQITPLQSTTFAEDFLKHLFTKTSEIHTEVTSQSELEKIIELVESILMHVRQKVQKLIGVEPSEFLDEQLSILTKDRSRSQSISSTTTSPLHFQGRQLTEAPAVTTNSALMKEFNSIFSKRMQTISSIVNSNSLGLKPSNEMLNKFYLYRWNFLLQSYEESLVQIWLVNVYSGTGNEYQMLVLNDSTEKPNVEHADKKYMRNIRELNLTDKMPELARLIILRVETEMTENLTILFYGCKGYLRVCGILNKKGSYEEREIARPNTRTHPHVTAKIRKVYNLWFEAKQKQMKNRFMNMTEIEKEDFKIAMTLRLKHDSERSETGSKSSEEPSESEVAPPPTNFNPHPQSKAYNLNATVARIQMAADAQAKVRFHLDLSHSVMI